MEERSFALTLTREEGYRFRVRFDDPSMGEILLDEPPPLGEGKAPNATRILAAAVGSCLSASFQYCLARAHMETLDIVTHVEGTLERNPGGRLRIGEVRVRLEPVLADGSGGRFHRCMDLFEDFCVVTESVRHGIDVLVEVRPRTPAEAALAAEENGPRRGAAEEAPLATPAAGD